MFRAWPVAVLLIAGCAGPAETVDSAPAGPGLPAALHAVGEEPGEWMHQPVWHVGHGTQLSWQGACEAACHVDVVPTGVGADAWLDVRVTWDGATQPGFALHVEDSDGQPVEADVRRGFDMARAVVWEPAEGSHRLVVTGAGQVAGEARLRSVDVPAIEGADRLPNLVTLTPIELSVGQCRLEESVEEDAVRCLRLGNSVGNVGDGPLEVHLDHVNAGMSAAGGGRFMQRIYQVGGYRDVPASGAEFHLAHGHFHYAGLAHFELYAVKDGLRGELAAAGHKRGFCFLDWGEMATPEAPPEREQHAQQNCLVPGGSGWSMGISRGWYDYYWKELADQYIDIEGVADGVYELVSIADGAGTLAETDDGDNEASVVLRLQGDAVTVLEERALYDNPERE